MLRPARRAVALLVLATLLASVTATWGAGPAAARGLVCDSTGSLCAAVVPTGVGQPTRGTVGEAVGLEVRFSTGVAADVHLERRGADGEWADVAVARSAGSGTEAYLDRPSVPGRYDYRVRFEVARTAVVLLTTPTLFSYDALAAPATYPSVVHADAPSSVRVRLGSSGPVVTGRVTDTSHRTGSRAGRTVVLRAAGVPGGAPVATTRTDAAGRWSLRVPTHFAYAARLVVEVGRGAVTGPGTSPWDAPSDLLGPARTEETVAVEVSPAYDPHGSGQHAYLFSGTRAWHDPCTVITYRVNPAVGPRGMLATTRRAVALVAQATGYRFRYAGTTAAVPFTGPDPVARGGDPRAVMTIAWTDDRHVPGLEGAVVGLGGAARSGRLLSHPLVAIDGAQGGVRPGFGRGVTYGSLLLHELGHAMGLGHVDDATLVMHAGLNRRSWGRYGAGDLAGLAAVDALNPCAPHDEHARAVPTSSVVLP